MNRSAENRDDSGTSKYVTAVFSEIDQDTGARIIVDFYTMDGALSNSRAYKFARHATPQYDDFDLSLERHNRYWGEQS